MVPLAEITDYSSRLKAITAGAGNFSQSFAHYAPAPPNVQRQLASAHQIRDDDE